MSSAVRGRGLGIESGKHMKFEFTSRLREALSGKYSAELVDIPVELCPTDFQGDVTVSCFPLAKMLRRNPMELAGVVGSILEADEDVESVQIVKAFVNVTLKAAALMRDTVADYAGLMAQVPLPAEERRRILIEFSAPNTNKPQHLGHVRNNSVGMATASILERAGNQVIRVNLVNDRGVHNETAASGRR